jgi:ABC-type lipoprotein release transport system permease subunit
MNLKLLDFALMFIFKKRAKNLALFFGLFLTVFLFTAVLFTALGIKKQVLDSIDKMPEITVQKVVGGRLDLIENDRVYDISQISGVSSVKERVWGYYYFPHRRLANGGVNLSIIGLDLYVEEYKQHLTRLTYDYFDALEAGKILVSKEVMDAMQRGYFKSFFDFYPPSGQKMRINIAKVLDEKLGIEGKDSVFMANEVARQLFGMREDLATDIIVKVANPLEVDNIAQKISEKYGDVRVITKSDLYATYNGMYDYKSGIFLALFIIAIFALFLLIYEKASGMGDEDKKEIATLRAIGWTVEDIIKLKFLEHSILSVFAFFFALIAAYLFVYVLQAPILNELFIGNSQLRAPLRLQGGVESLQIASVVVIATALYLSIVLIPIWRGAVIDVGENVK